MTEGAVHTVPVADGESVEVDWTPPTGASPIAVFIHGFGSHRRGEKAQYFAVRFVETGWGFLSFDLRGHGDSGGYMRNLSLTNQLADIAAVMDWLPSKTMPLLMIGSSMGAGLAAWYLLRRHPQVQGLVMIAPALRFPWSLHEQLSAAELAAWERDGVRRIQNNWLDVEIGYGLVQDARSYDPGRLIREHRTPSLIFHGMRDDSIPWQQSMHFAERCPGTVTDLMLVKRGDHRLTDYMRFLYETIVSWWNGLERQQPAP